MRYLELQARSLVGRCSTSDMPFTWTAYRRAYAGRTHLEGEYPRRTSALFAALRARHGLDEDAFERRPPRAAAARLLLWDEPVQSSGAAPRACASRSRRG